LSEYEKALFDKSNQIVTGTNAKTVSFAEEDFPQYNADSTQELNKTTDEGFSKNYHLPYLDSDQNKNVSGLFYPV